MSPKSLCVFYACLLAACANGPDTESSDIVDNEVPDIVDRDIPLSYVELEELYSQIEDNIDPVFDLTPTANLPTQGHVSYEGIVSVVIFQPNPTGEEALFEQAVLGTAHIDADFATNTLSGEATNFYNDNDQTPTAGSLTFSDGAIDRSGTDNAVTIDAVGEVTFEDGVVAVDSALAGAFTTASADYLTVRGRDPLVLDGSDADTIGVAVFVAR